MAARRALDAHGWSACMCAGVSAKQRKAIVTCRTSQQQQMRVDGATGNFAEVCRSTTRGRSLMSHVEVTCSVPVARESLYKTYQNVRVLHTTTTTISVVYFADGIAMRAACTKSR